MSLSSLPKYPPPPFDLPAAPVPTPRLSARQRRAILDLVWLAGLLAFLFWARQTADAIRHRPPPLPPTPPQEFEVIRKRFDEVKLFGTTQDEVYRLLGPPNSYDHRVPEIADFNELIAAHPDRYPGKRSWAMWADPKDESRWVAVLYVGKTVYRKLQNGLGSPEGGSR